MAEQVMLPDPRPRTAHGEDGVERVQGLRCPACSYTTAALRPWCPRCRSELEPALFGPRGVVWSSTVLRVPLPGRTPPYVLAYVDLEDGPRVLAHVDGGPPERLPVGSTVAVRGLSEDGDLLVGPAE